MAAEESDPSTQVLRALAYAQAGMTATAREQLEALDIAALDLDARVDMAAVHLALGELAPAIEILQSIHSGNDRHPLLLARLAWCHLLQGRGEEAALLFERSLGSRKHIAVYQNLLRIHLDGSDLAAAARCLADAQAFWETEQAAWPESQRAYHSQQLDLRQLELWTACEAFAEAEEWLGTQSERLAEERWCGLLIAYAQALAARDQHAQAEERLRDGRQRYPENLGLIHSLADLAESQGRAGQTRALLRRAIDVAQKQGKTVVPIRLKLAAAALLTQPELALKAAQKALDEASQLAPDDGTFTPDQIQQWLAQAETALANAECHLQNYAAAEARFRKVIAERPHFLPALQGLGQLHMQLGRIDEAVTLFERVKSIDPARGYAALINARRFPEDESTLEKLEALARRPSLEGSVRSGLLLQLAAAWEKRKAFDRAFALADEANAASRRQLRYNAKVHRQRCARIRHAFSKSLYERRVGCGLDSTLPVFVVGMPRSGTTLVEQILAGHSRIHGAGELGVIPRVIAGLERWERHTGSGRSYPDCVDDLDTKVTAGIAESVLSELREYAPDAAHVVDKLPHNFENIGLIKFLFPKAKIISVRRDPRDIAVSNFFTDYAAKRGGMGFAYDLDWIGEQLADHNLLLHHWQRIFPGEILEIQYEDVIADPEASARRLLDYIGVEWEPQVLKFNELDRPVKTASVWQVRQPIYQTSKAKWRRYERHLAPLIAACNRKIEWQPIEMTTLPEPGWLNQGVDLFRAKRLDEAERCFNQLLHFVPEHAAATFMLGLVYASKGHLDDGIELMETAHHRCPWNRNWRRDLAQAYRLTGRSETADALEAAATGLSPAPDPDDPPPDDFAATCTEPMTFAKADPIR